MVILFLMILFYWRNWAFIEQYLLILLLACRAIWRWL